MDVLTSLIIPAHELGVVSATSGCSPLQRLSMYVDDVVLFVGPMPSDMMFIKDALRIFGNASVLHVNFAKSVAIMIRGELADKELVQVAMPWQMQNFP